MSTSAPQPSKPAAGTSSQPEQQAIVGFLGQLAGLLGPLSPFAKAVVPAALSLVVAAVNSAFSGTVDTVSLTIAASGLVLALVTFLIPNLKRPAEPAAAPSGK